MTDIKQKQPKYKISMYLYIQFCHHQEETGKKWTFYVQRFCTLVKVSKETKYLLIYYNIEKTR